MESDAIPLSVTFNFLTTLGILTFFFVGLVTFYLGILTLIIAVLTFVAVTVSTPTKIVMSLIVAFTLLPTTYFIFVRPLFERPKGAPAASSGNIQMSEVDPPLSSPATAMPVPLPYATPSGGYINVAIQPPAVEPNTPS